MSTPKPRATPGPAGPGAPGSREKSARERMIDVAEELIAEYGVEAVSLRTVGAQAGQRNNSAAQYHFGSKEGLIHAIIAVRSPGVDARRQELVSEYRRSGADDIESLVRLLVLPLAETIDRSGERTWYLRFLANVMDHPMWHEVGEPAEGEQPALRYMARELRKRLPHLSGRTLRRRSRWMAIIAFRVLADHERELAAATRRNRAPSTNQVVEELVDTLVALLRSEERGTQGRQQGSDG
ncbi:TetR family transcriptional regulator [Saccharopolyspora sp. NPDC000359]|uniref:TetR family transcriptional regulator n=1 Tax=Saccharopolyspora sp. NPDC000359 TaxID=3154251 RepID=UPI0033208B1E